jgi:hypothetical protein
MKHPSNRSVQARSIHLLAVVLLLTTLTGCDILGSDERGFRTSEPHRMTHIKQALVRGGIPFREGADGTIWFDKRLKPAVDAVVAATDGSHVTRTISLEDPGLGEVALKALRERGIEGTLDESGVSWTTTIREDSDEVADHVHAALSAHLANATAPCPPGPTPCTD